MLKRSLLLLSFIILSGVILAQETNTEKKEPDKKENFSIENIVFKGPENLKAEVNGIKVKLTWDAINIQGITYNIYRSTHEQAEFIKINKEDVKTNEYIDDKNNSIIPPLSDIKYFYKVTAVDSGKEIGESNMAFAIPSGNLSPPDEITAIPSPGKVLLKWAEPDSKGKYDIDGYNIFRATDVNFEGEKINTLIIRAFEYEDTKNIENDVKYFYRLQTVDVKGNTSAFSKPIEALPFTQTSEPTQVTAVAVSSESIKVSWFEPDIKGTYGISGYNIYRSENPASFPEKPINLKLVKPYYDEEGKVFYFDNIINSETPPQPGKMYYYKIVPVDDKGNKGIESKLANTKIELLETKKSGILTADISEYGLPPESRLTITGNKQVQISSKWVAPATAIESSRPFDIKQPLKVTVNGRIGKKISIDVDYDDSRPQDEQRKILIKYEGEKEETIQEASFGDIMLDIPATRFVSYSQSLFGIKTTVKLGDKLKITGIGAQTKGITAVQKFKGNLREKEINGKKGIEINDTDFIKNTYYYITKENVQIKPGSVVVYIDNANAYDNIQTRQSYPTGKFNFDLKILGIDYTVDYKNKIIKFNVPINDQYIIAVAFETMDGRKIGFDASGAFDFNEVNLISDSNGITSQNAHLIQDGTQQNPKDISHKVVSYYYMGETQIYNPLIDKDFRIRIYDKAKATEYYIPQPWEPDATNWYEIDTDFGILKFKGYYPFVFPSNSPGNPNNTRIGTEDDAYKTVEPINSRYIIYLEYKYYAASFKLDYPNVVYGSEKIFLNGRLLKKDVDYYILYETGDITFIDKNLIQPDSEITIVYEYFPFLQAFPSNLFGGRAEYKVLDNLSLGSTFLYKSASASSRIIPDARSTNQGLATPYRMYILDGDVKFNLTKENINKVLDALPFVTNPDVPVDFSFQAEMAQSNFNPNIFDKNNEHGVAMIDNMEGADNIISTSMDINYWFPASRPQASDIGNRIKIRKTNINDIDPAPSSGSDIYGSSSQRKTMLQFNYDNLTNNTWDAFRYVISSYGENLNNYSYIEMWVYTTQPIEIGVDLGVISEDSNGNSVLDTEDTYGGRANGILETGEDIGIDQSGDEYWGANNRMLDTEDTNNNGILDTLDSYYQYRQQITQTGVWKNIKIDLKKIGAFTGYNVQPNPTSNQFLSLVKHARIVIRGISGNPVSGYVKLSSLDVTGNSWTLKVLGNSYDRAGNLIDSPDVNKFNVSTVNQYTEPSYVPNVNFFEYQKEEDKKSEKSLKITYNQSNLDLLSNGSPIYYATKILTQGNGYDYQSFKKLKFDVFYSKRDGASGSGKIFFVRLGTGTLDNTNYYQYNIQLDDIPADNNWHTVEINLDGSDKKRSPAVGIPNLNKINYISIGVINPNSIAANEIIYLNNLRLTDPIEKVGTGKYAGTNINYTGIGNLSHSFEEMESDFITIADIGKNMAKQHTINNTVNFNYNQISFLPINNTFTKNEAFTENKYRDDPEYTNNFSIPDVVTEGYTNSESFTLIPNLTLSNYLSLNNNKYRYLKYYVYQDHDEERFRIEPNAKLNLPNEISLPLDNKIPLGNNAIESKITLTNEKSRYFYPEAVSYCANCYDSWRMDRNQDYKWTGNYKINNITISPVYQYILNEQKGNLLNRYQYYSGRISAFRNYADDYIILRRDIKPSVLFSFGDIFIFNPQINYSTSHTMDYTVNTLYTTGELGLTSKIELNKILNILPNISNYNISVNVNESYNDTYYNNSIDKFGKLPFETRWFINNWENIINDKKIEELEAISYNGSMRINHDVTLSEIKLWDKIAFSPRGGFSVLRNSSSQALNTLTNTLNFGLYNIQIFKVNIPGLEKFVKDEIITGQYSYSNNKTLDPVTKKDIINEVISNNANVTLNYKDNDAQENPLTGQLSVNYVKNDNRNRNLFIWNYTLKPELSINYSLKFNKPFVFPVWFPLLGGKAIKFEQNIFWINRISAEIIRGDDVGGIGTNRQSSEKYRAETQFNYKFMENIDSFLSLAYEKNVDAVRGEKYNYHSLEITISVTASF